MNHTKIWYGGIYRVQLDKVKTNAEVIRVVPPEEVYLPSGHLAFCKGTGHKNIVYEVRLLTDIGSSYKADQLVQIRSRMIRFAVYPPPPDRPKERHYTPYERRRKAAMAAALAGYKQEEQKPEPSMPVQPAIPSFLEVATRQNPTVPPSPVPASSSKQVVTVHLSLRMELGDLCNILDVLSDYSPELHSVVSPLRS